MPTIQSKPFFTAIYTLCSSCDRYTVVEDDGTYEGCTTPCMVVRGMLDALDSTIQPQSGRQ
jgi:hypothetical protein